jgi:alpha-galactosidase
MNIRLSALALAILLLLCQQIMALDDGQALTPPMGWNSWNTFELDVNEQLIKDMADAMVNSGMKDAGYTCLVIDVGWQSGRDGSGNFTVNTQRFPSGIKALADYVHGKELKFGLYTDAGRETCIDGRPGSLGHEEQDAAKFAEWTVDFVKADWCGSDGLDAKQVYTTLGKALEESGRPILFSLCEWGADNVWEWAAPVGHMWRTTGDIKDCWDCWVCTHHFSCPRGWTLILDAQVGLEEYAGPGGWNDPDMLEVGNAGLSYEEWRAHFSLWCILAAPLIAGNDLRNMSDQVKEILTNSEVIAVDQDSMGAQGRRIRKEGDLEVWAKPLADSSRALALFNRSGEAARITARFSDAGLTQSDSFMVRDLWQKKDMGIFREEYSAEVSSHGVVMVRVFPFKDTVGQTRTASPLVPGPSVRIQCPVSANPVFRPHGQVVIKKACGGNCAAVFDCRGKLMDGHKGR